MSRAFGPWGKVALILIVFHFALPFLLLLQRNVKRRVERLRLGGGDGCWSLSMVDVYWLIVPAYEPDSIQLGPMLQDLVFLGIGAIWVAFYFWQCEEDAAAAAARSAV